MQKGKEKCRKGKRKWAKGNSMSITSTINEQVQVLVQLDPRSSFVRSLTVEYAQSHSRLEIGDWRLKIREVGKSGRSGKSGTGTYSMY